MNVASKAKQIAEKPFPNSLELNTLISDIICLHNQKFVFEIWLKLTSWQSQFLGDLQFSCLIFVEIKNLTLVDFHAILHYCKKSLKLILYQSRILPYPILSMIIFLCSYVSVKLNNLKIWIIIIIWTILKDWHKWEQLQKWGLPLLGVNGPHLTIGAPPFYS